MDNKLPSLDGEPLMVAAGELIRTRMLETADGMLKALNEQFDGSRSDEWPELMQQIEILESLPKQTDAEWWLARRSRSVASVVREAAASRGEVCG